MCLSVRIAKAKCIPNVFFELINDIDNNDNVPNNHTKLRDLKLGIPQYYSKYLAYQGLTLQIVAID